MTYHFEFIQPKGELPVRAFIHSAKNTNPHWHSQLEFSVVLEGSVSITVSGRDRVLKPGDFILLNSHEVHNMNCTDSPGLLLTLQIEMIISKLIQFNDFKRAVA